MSSFNIGSGGGANGEIWKYNPQLQDFYMLDQLQREMN